LLCLCNSAAAKDCRHRAAKNRRVHALFVHKSFPAQLGHIAAWLVRERGWECTFVSETEPGVVEGVRKLRYRPQGGATEATHYYSRTFENAIWHAAGVYDALRGLRNSLAPDLIVGHSGFGSTLLLPELFPQAPVVNLFEYYYRPHGSDLDFRPEFPPAEEDVLRARARNAMILLDLEECALGYCPTEFQRGLFPAAYAPKLDVVHDGVDVSFWRRRDDPGDLRAQLQLPAGTRVVTYCSRGLEAMRGFDVFMRVAKRVYTAYPDVVFCVVGTETVAYGGDLRHTGGVSFRDWVLAQDAYDAARFRFLGAVPPELLARVLSLSDLHVHLTVPFVLSWSLLDAMACGCTVLASDTAPVREVIAHNVNGLLRDFFDADALAAAAVEVLEAPEDYADLGREAERTVRERYALEVVMPRMLALYERALAASS
jgi:glycosyltransferase involved in cell wall biosynthesis